MTKDDSDWLKEIEDVKPLKKQAKAEVKISQMAVDDWDDLLPPEKRLKMKIEEAKQLKS